MKSKQLMLSVLILWLPSACSNNSSGSSTVPAPPSAFTPLPYTENFDNPASGWKIASDESIKIQYQNSALNFTLDALNAIAWSTPNQKFGDFTFEVDATQVDGPDDNGYGVIVRYVDDRNFYRLDISGDGYFDVLKYKAGIWIKLQDWTESTAIQPGATTNHLRVAAQGNQFTFSVNDQIVKTFTDDDFRQGDIGLSAGTFFDHAGVQVAFDNLKVTGVKP
ncbi:MAG TPA: family 16 glycoside hydrolase [Anaerolineae bacterium]|nr:family 16 glycoside hydrolase [Anaerolineae bacterium]